jgi:hypothetical protein
MFRRIIRLAVIGWVASMVVGVVAALQARQRIGPTTDESADEMTASAIFGPLAYHSTATSFRGGSLECWYGGGVLDLRDAVLAPGGATLSVRAVFGGGQILVPSGWRVVTTVKVVMGAVSDARDAVGNAEDAPTLTIDGMVFAGGFAVMSELDSDGEEWLEDMEAKRDVAVAAGPGSAATDAVADTKMEPASAG